MPNHVTKFPSKAFAEQFEEASGQVRSYFEFCHDVAERFRTAREQRSQLEAAGKRRRSQLKNFRRLMTDIAHDFDVSYSYACIAKQCELLSNLVYGCLNQAAAWSRRFPSLKMIPWMTSGSSFAPSSRRQRRSAL